QMFERPFGLTVGTGDKDSIYRCGRRDIGINKRSPGDGRDEKRIAILCNGGSVTVRNAETWHIPPPRKLYGFDRFTETPSKADRDQKILRRHYLHSVMHDAAASDRCVSVVTQPDKRVC